MSVHDEIGDVAMDEHLAAAGADHLVGVHAAVRASDEQPLGLLADDEAFEVFGVACEFVGHPLAVALDQLVVDRRVHVASRPHDRQDTSQDMDAGYQGNRAE